MDVGCCGMYVDILGHFTHGKAHVSIEICTILVQESDDVRYRDLMRKYFEFI
jgi:hypothetical protein